MVSDANFENLTSYLQQLVSTRRIPPLETWQPEFCGTMDLIIKANGEWWHEGQPIRRQAMIDLFSKVLWKEKGQYYLKTPVEKIKIKVEDAPLLITTVDQIEIDGLVYVQMTSKNQDTFLLDHLHPLSIRSYQGENRPYVRVRYELDALIQRQAFYHMVEYGELSEQEDAVYLKLQSGLRNFMIGMD